MISATLYARMSSADAGVIESPAHSGQDTGIGSRQAPNARTRPNPAQIGQPFVNVDHLFVVFGGKRTKRQTTSLYALAT